MATQTIEPRMELEQNLHMYRQMAKIRAFEEQVNELYKSAKMPGLAHLYVGEEGVAVGVCEALRRDDFITSTHRGHGHCLAKGALGQPDVRRAPRQGAGLLPRQGRLDAHRRSRDGQPRRQRHRRRLGRHRDRRRAVGQDARQPAGGRVLLRRRRAGPGPPLRGDEHGRALEAAGHLRLREQPLRRVHAVQRDHRRRDPGAARGPSASTPRASTARTFRRSTRRCAGSSSARAAARGRPSSSARPTGTTATTSATSTASTARGTKRKSG